METILNFFKKSKLKIDIDETDDHFILISGILVEAASIDGNIDESEILKIKRSLINFLEISEEKSNQIINMSLKKVDNPNSLHYFTSKINKKNSIILIDAQGHEPEIFLGAKKTLKKKVPLIFELMPNLINENQLKIIFNAILHYKKLIDLKEEKIMELNKTNFYKIYQHYLKNKFYTDLMIF